MSEFWNAKFERNDYFYGTRPNQYIKQQSTLLKHGSAIACLGEGEGRNAVYLARRGHDVVALDSSDVGLQKACELALVHDVVIQTLCLDLSEWHPCEHVYDGVVTSFCHLSEPLRTHVWERVASSLVTGGYFIGEFFSHRQLEFQSGGPKDPALLYELEEVRSLVKRLPFDVIELEETVVFLDEGVGHQGDASVIRMTLKKI